MDTNVPNSLVIPSCLCHARGMEASPDLSLTQVLDQIRSGNEIAEEQLMNLAYNELRQLAHSMMAREREGHTLQATALVHEAYIKFSKPDGKPNPWNSRAHFFSAAAEAMRRILIDNSRKKMAAKRGGGVQHTEWDDSQIAGAVPDRQLLAIDEALRTLEKMDTDLALLVKLRYFVGMTVQETASILEISPRNVNRQWECAKVWFRTQLSQE